MLTNLKKLRTERKLSQQELADILGISQQSINKYENHNVQPDLETIKRMADFFQTSVDYLIGYNGCLQVESGKNTIQLSNEETVLLAQFRKLSDSQKKCLRMLLGTWKI